MKNRYKGLLAVFVMSFMAGCGPSTQQSVVVYTSVDRIFAEPVLQRAQEVLGIKVIGVYDTEETKSSGLVNRLIAKRNNPDGDIFWSGDPARAAFLKREGITVSYEPPGVEAIPEVFKDPDRYWIGFSARTRVLLVNTELVALGEEPLSIFDLVQEQWKGKVAIANPLFGTTSFHLAALVQVLGEDRVFEWLDALKANGVHVVSSNGEVKRQVASGQVAVGLTDSDDAVEAITDGQPVRVVLLDQSTSSGTPLGNLILPNTVSLIQGGPNPAVAKNVLDFLVSVPVQIMLAESCAQAPLTPAVPVPDSVVVLDGIVSMEVDYAACATILEGIMPRFKEWLEQK